MTTTEAFEAFILDEVISENKSPKTIDSYECTCNSLLRSLKEDIPIGLLAYVHIIRWKKDMHDWNNRASYIAQNLRNLRAVLTYLRKHGFSVLDPAEITLPKYAYRETAWLTQDEIIRFFKAIDSKRDKALFAMQFSSGARISELLSLNRDSIVDKSAKVRGKGKISREDVLYFDDNSLLLLDKYLKTRTDTKEPLFLSRNGLRFHVGSAIRNCHKYAESAGLDKNVSTHVMRHSFGTHLHLNGMDIYDVSKQMRHSKIETTKIYIHDNGDTRKKYETFHLPSPLV